MLERRLEPEVMDTAEEAATYDAMDHGAVNAAFVADFLALHGPCRGGVLLDVGTGTALIPITLAKSDPVARILGIDLAAAMLELGRHNIQTAGLSDRIDLSLVDAKRTGLPSGQYEAVLSNTIIHHIPEPAAVLAEMARLVAPTGTLFIRDLARPDDDATLDHLVQAYTGAETPAAQQLFRESLHAALTLDEVRAMIEPLGYGPDTVAMTSDRHWTWSARGKARG
jgi:ubiquinone/menaquinone biosynthesis C-methylase UbiE